MSNKQIKLIRREQEQIFMGVCAGIADYLNLDPFWVRFAFVVLTLASGIGFALYFALMLLMPSPNDYDAPYLTVMEHNFRTFLKQFQTHLFHLLRKPKQQSVAGLFSIALGFYLLITAWSLLTQLFWPFLIIGGLYLLFRR